MSKHGKLKLLALLPAFALACALPACKGERPSSPPKPKTEAPAARTRDAAMADLMALPELKAWSAQIEKASGGATHPALVEDDPEPKTIDGKKYWQFSFVENARDAAHRWESFLVAQSGTEILVEDFATDTPLTLEQWRRDRRPSERTAAQ
ncbi:MAG: hypothetical protein ACJ8LG_16160 [Massilia sp.]